MDDSECDAVRPRGSSQAVKASMAVAISTDGRRRKSAI